MKHTFDFLQGWVILDVEEKRPEVAMTRIRYWLPFMLGLSAGATLWLALTAHTVHADGVPIPPYGTEADIQMPGQKAIIVYDEQTGREDLVLSVQLLGESPEAAWVVPVPSQPEVHTASAEWFVQLSDLTQPEIVTETRFLPTCGGVAPPGAAPGKVTVLSREKVGAYDVSILASDDPTALLRWLNENGYAFPKRGEPILDDYISEGWYFMATRVRPGANANLDVDMQPLWLSFQTARPVYPMRLTSLVTTPIDVLIYVLADHRMALASYAGLDVEFAGELTLQPEPSETGALGNLLAGRPYYVTKFRNWYHDVSTESDLYFDQASDDTPYRRTIYRHRAVCCPAYPALAPLGLAAGLGLWKRRRLRS